MKAAVIGGAGYAGGELLRLLLSHPQVEVTQVTSERLGGKFVHTVHPHLRRRTELKFQSRASLQPVDVLFIALPHGETSKEIDQLQTLAPTIIDLSADFRLRDRAGYPTWYGWEHPKPDLLQDFVYALPELHREEIQNANRLATGGCLATAAILGLYPLTRAGVIDHSMPIVIEGKTGSSAGGAEAGPESKKKHASAAMVAAQRLHGRVVDYSHRFAERRGKIEAGPAFAQMLWFFCDLPLPHTCGEAN